MLYKEVAADDDSSNSNSINYIKNLSAVAAVHATK